MNPDTLSALLMSIKKWEDIVKGGEDHGTQNCALCARFYNHGSCRSPVGELCPVAEKTGAMCCEDSPYVDWLEATKTVGKYTPFPRIARDDESLMCAVLELEFLKELLPEKELSK